MTIVARAPGKLVILGEYAVLAGAPALVMAVDRHCRVELGPSAEADCRLQLSATTESELRFAPDATSGVEVVDLVRGRWPTRPRAPWCARLDSRALHGRGGKLGLGSSAAVLTAWAGAWAEYAGRPQPELRALVELHREWQQGRGSGLDVAASRLGGVLGYRIRADGEAETISVPLPDGVGFVGVFSGKASSTRDLLARFDGWRAHAPRAADARLAAMGETAERGIAAAQSNDADAFLSAAARYAEQLAALGQDLGAEIATARHRAIARAAERCGVTYKISGAGGGDMGLGLASDPETLEAFVAALPAGCEAIRLHVDGLGLVTEVRPA